MRVPRFLPPAAALAALVVALAAAPAAHATVRCHGMPEASARSHAAPAEAADAPPSDGHAHPAVRLTGEPGGRRCPAGHVPCCAPARPHAPPPAVPPTPVADRAAAAPASSLPAPTTTTEPPPAARGAPPGPPADRTVAFGKLLI